MNEGRRRHSNSLSMKTPRARVCPVCREYGWTSDNPISHSDEDRREMYYYF